MNSTSPPPVVDRMERTANPLVLAVLALAIAGVGASLWLAPDGLAALVVTGAVVGLAFFGAAGLLLFALGLLRFPTRAGRSDTAKTIADRVPTAFWSPTASPASSTPTPPIAPFRAAT